MIKTQPEPHRQIPESYNPGDSRTIWTVFYLVLTLMNLGGSCISCRSQEHFSHPLYDLDHPKRLRLPAELDEISGLAFDPRDSGLFAVADEKGVVFKIFPSGKSRDMQQWILAPDGDYEDLAFTDSMLWLLRSDGKLSGFSFPLQSGMPAATQSTVGEKDDEFESLLSDPSRKNSLILICKNCSDDKKGSVGCRIFNIHENTFSSSEFLFIKKKELNIDFEEKFRLRPTAAVWDAARKRFLVLTSNPALLMELTEDRKLIQAYQLDPSIYRQVEGIAVSGDGTLFISTERGKAGEAELFILPAGSKAIPQ